MLIESKDRNKARKFGRLKFLVGAAFLGCGIGVQPLIHWSTSVPESDEKVPLIHGRWGLAPYLFQRIVSDPHLLALSSEFATSLVSNSEKKFTPSFGDQVSHVVSLATRILYSNSQIALDDQSSRLKIVEAASVVYAAATSTWYFRDRLHQLGFPPERLALVSNDLEGSRKYFWAEGGVGWSFPVILAMEGEKDPLGKAPTKGGEDGPLHAGTHWALHTLYAGSKLRGDDLHTRIPNAIKWRTWSYQDPLEEARAVSEMAGVLYEISNLIRRQRVGPFEISRPRAENFPIFGNKPREGVWDSSVDPDYGANRIGAAISTAFFRLIWVNKPFEEIYAVLNDPIIARYPEGLAVLSRLDGIG